MATRTIFREYADALGVDLCFQGFEAELAELPGDYGGARRASAAGPGRRRGGRLRRAFRARYDVDHANACEMKRLFVRPAFRRFGLGRRMAEALMDEARRCGYFGDAAGHARRHGGRAKALRLARLRRDRAVLH